MVGEYRTTDMVGKELVDTLRKPLLLFSMVYYYLINTEKKTDFLGERPQLWVWAPNKDKKLDQVKVNLQPLSGQFWEWPRGRFKCEKHTPFITILQRAASLKTRHMHTLATWPFSEPWVHQKHAILTYRAHSYRGVSGHLALSHVFGAHTQRSTKNNRNVNYTGVSP